MRILDLGAHDGFIGTWLSGKLEKLQIDGVEANSEGVRRANGRAEKHGIAGRYVQGLAEDAEHFFDAGQYDAVVAFELIEHVPDVDTFLSVCERMLRPGGRVYLSTPNGCFGEGGNPHHLRVYRAQDLFELIRRRGTVNDMLAGHDGVAVVSYTPGVGPKPELAIYTGPGWEKWHPSDIANKGLGGSETAAIRLAEALSERYNVTVYGECDYCAWRQTMFKPHHTFDGNTPRDVVIVSRAPWLADQRLNAKHVALWMHDTSYPGMTPERMAKFDSVLALSEWHKEHLIDGNDGVLSSGPMGNVSLHGDRSVQLQSEVLSSKVHVFGNAIEPRYFDGPGTPERPRIALYSSSPDRGLDVLLRLWPRVREAVPDAELHYCYSSVYHRVAEANPEVAKFRDTINELRGVGVKDLGSLDQKALAKKMRTCAVWLAPSWHGPTSEPFFETYCIGAQEAAAAGCCVIVSDWGALTERVEDAVNSISIPAPEDGSSGIREDEWVQAIINGMTQVTYESSASALDMTWAKRADQLEEIIGNVVPASTR